MGAGVEVDESASVAEGLANPCDTPEEAASAVEAVRMAGPCDKAGMERKIAEAAKAKEEVEKQAAVDKAEADAKVKDAKKKELKAEADCAVTGKEVKKAEASKAAD